MGGARTIETPAVPVPSPLSVALRTPGVVRLLALALVARTPQTVVGLLLLLRVRELGGSYALGGVVAGGCALGLALAAPSLGRLIDRLGQFRVLAACVAVASGAMIAAGLLPQGTAPLTLLPLAVVAGAAQPPIAASLRALLGHVLPDEDTRHAALAVEASAQELSFMLGPLVFVSLIGARDAATGLVAGGATLIGFTLAFALSRESRGVPGRSSGAAVPAGALRAPGMRILLGVSVGIGTTFGAAEVAITASASDAGHPGAVGALLGAYCLGSLLAGLYVARRGSGDDHARRLAQLLVLVCVSHALLVVVPGLWWLGAALLVAGAAVAPTFAVLYALVGRLAIAGTTTEAFAWIGSGLYAGTAVGAALGGALITAVDVRAAFGVAVLSAGLAAGGAIGRGTLLRDPAGPPTAA